MQHANYSKIETIIMSLKTFLVHTLLNWGDMISHLLSLNSGYCSNDNILAIIPMIMSQDNWKRASGLGVLWLDAIEGRTKCLLLGCHFHRPIGSDWWRSLPSPCNMPTQSWLCYNVDEYDKFLFVTFESNMSFVPIFAKLAYADKLRAEAHLSWKKRHINLGILTHK